MSAKRPGRKPQGGTGPGDGARDDAAAPRPGGGVDPGLHLVATPIGNAGDVTLRALEVLAGAEVIAAEDTRSARRLMEMHGIALGGRRLVPYHDRNGETARPALLAALREGRSVALVSDAGTPLIADPGFKLVRAAAEAGLPVTALPGPSAVLAALCLSGLPTDRFLFAGFPPPRQAARRAMLAELRGLRATLVFLESPRRTAETLADMATVLGAGRAAALCRDLTKRFEEVRRGALGALAEAAAAEPPRGEVVLVVGPPEAEADDDDALDAALHAALARLSPKAAVAEVAAATGRPRREVYARALALGDRGD